jgi:hypothetical protein
MLQQFFHSNIELLKFKNERNNIFLFSNLRNFFSFISQQFFSFFACTIKSCFSFCLNNFVRRAAFKYEAKMYTKHWACTCGSSSTILQKSSRHKSDMNIARKFKILLLVSFQKILFFCHVAMRFAIRAWEMSWNHKWCIILIFSNIHEVNFKFYHYLKIIF